MEVLKAQQPLTHFAHEQRNRLPTGAKWQKYMKNTPTHTHNT